MKKTLTAYKIIATIVGVLLIVLVVIGLPMDLLGSDGSTVKDIGAFITQDVGIAHGYLYMVYLVTTFLLARQAKWDMPFSIVTLLCGTIPFASFWAEIRAIRKVQAEHAEVLAA